MHIDFKGYPRIFLHTGDCFIGVQPTMVSTVLGSCVAVTMYSPETSISTICHAFLPDSTANCRAAADPQPCRHVDTAVETMLSALTRLGADLNRLEVKIMGGASGLGGMPKGGSQFNIGFRNVAMAQAMLAERGIAVKATHVGGSRGRNVRLLTHTGEIWIKQLSRMASAEAALREGRICR